MCFCRRFLDKLPFRNATASSLDTILVLCRRFHLFSMQLRRRYGGRDAVSIQDEYDVQDLFHAIFLLPSDDVRAEEVTPSCAGNSSRVDFYLPDARLVVEVKMTRQSLQQRQVADELIKDAARYAAMERVETLVCLVYDPGIFAVILQPSNAMSRNPGESLRCMPSSALEVCNGSGADGHSGLPSIIAEGCSGAWAVVSFARGSTSCCGSCSTTYACPARTTWNSLSSPTLSSAGKGLRTPRHQGRTNRSHNTDTVKPRPETLFPLQITPIHHKTRRQGR